jgi:hypothetical protein
MSVFVTQLIERNKVTRSKANGLTANVYYMVRSDDADLSFLDALDATGIPEVGDLFLDTNVPLSSKNATVQQDLCHWIVVCNYGVEQDEGGGSSSTDPLEDPPDINISHEVYETAAQFAYDSGGRTDPDKAIVNSAGDPFDPPLVQENSVLVISVTRNEVDYDSGSSSLVNTINSGSVSIGGVSIPEKCGRIRNIGGRTLTDSNGDQYWSITYEIEVRFEGQKKKLLDLGYYFLEGEKKQPIQIKDGVLGYFGENNDPVTEPQLLNGEGGIGDKANPKFLEFQTYYATSWGSLDLPA